MPSYLPSSGPLSINDLKDFFGGPASPSISDYYRGGAYTPSTVSTTTTEGPFYNRVFNGYWSNRWNVDGLDPFWDFYWGTGPKLSNYPSSSTTYAGYTYYQGPTNYGSDPTCPPGRVYYFNIYRTYVTTVPANTGIPSSGTISISQFYGAEKS